MRWKVSTHLHNSESLYQTNLVIEQSEEWLCRALLVRDIAVTPLDGEPDLDTRLDILVR